MMALLPARRLGEGYQWVGVGVGVGAAARPVGADGSAVGCFVGAVGSDEACVAGEAGACVRVASVADGVVFGDAEGLGELAGVEVEAVLAGAPPDG
jgi:hypothetical protein